MKILNKNNDFETNDTYMRVIDINEVMGDEGFKIHIIQVIHSKNCIIQHFWRIGLIQYGHWGYFSIKVIAMQEYSADLNQASLCLNQVCSGLN